MLLHKKHYLLTIAVLLIIEQCGGEKVMNGRYTQNLKHYELLVPHKVDQLGNFESFHLPHFFQPNFEAYREKRDFNHPESVRYNLFFDGKDHVIELLPNYGLTSPEFVREYHYKDSGKSLKARRFEMEHPVMCHYTGSVKDIEGSRVALSTCDGLAGFVSTSSGGYFIEPVAEHGPNDEGHLLHIIHKARDTSSKGKVCGTTNWEEDWTNAFNYHHGIKNNRFSRSKPPPRRFLELMVVIDKAFLDFHKDNDPERYVLTIMNMASNFYHDESIGNQINIVITRLIRLEEDHPMELELSSDGSKTLKSFCKWQDNQNPKKDSNRHHHDAAILLTRHDICIDGSCDLLGLAYGAAVCVPKQSCAINEDNGLMLGVTVTHEIGHLIGSRHDERTGCPPRDEHKFNHVMAPSVRLSTGKWSNCSREDIQNLFNNQMGECLNDEPTSSDYKFEESLPGTIYDADYQCRTMFGEGAKICPSSKEDICGLLLCEVDDKCWSNSAPAADGTSCGNDKWCIRKECVKVGKRGEDAIAGNWSKWSSWSACNRQCGGGIKFSERDCTDPIPKNGGKFCDGESKRYQVCNTMECNSTEASSFRQEQCEAFNDKNTEWTSEFVSSRSCTLFCSEADESTEKQEKASQVKDGTFCNPGTNDMCIAGICKNVGCDWKLDSHAVDDDCGVCKGDESTCKIINGTVTFSNGDHQQNISLPENARNIVVKKLAPSSSKIQLVDPKTMENFLFNYKVGEVNVGGVVALLESPQKGKEEILIKGPLKKNLLACVNEESGHPTRIYYKYALVRDDEDDAKSTVLPMNTNGPFAWDYPTPDSNCEVKCGIGILTFIAVCTSKIGKVSDEFCKQPKPGVKKRFCNSQPCTFKWQSRGWSKCTGSYHQPCEQKRVIWCGLENREWDLEAEHVDDSKCLSTVGWKPPIRRLCFFDCTRKSGGKRSTKTSRDIVEHSKNVNIFALKPEIFIIPDETVNDKESCEDTDLNSLKRIDSIPEIENNDKSSEKSINSTNVEKFFMVHPFITTHPKNHFRRNAKKLEPGRIIVDKLPKLGKWKEFPIVDGKPQRLSDEAFRKLGDKV